jgi:transposase
MAEMRVLTGPERRRHWTDDQKRAILEQAFAPGVSLTEFCRRMDLSRGMLYTWRKELWQPQGLARVVVAPDATRPQPPPESVVELFLGGEQCLRIPLNTPPDLAAALLRAVAQQ